MLFLVVGTFVDWCFRVYTLSFPVNVRASCAAWTLFFHFQQEAFAYGGTGEYGWT